MTANTHMQTPPFNQETATFVDLFAAWLDDPRQLPETWKQKYAFQTYFISPRCIRSSFLVNPSTHFLDVCRIGNVIFFNYPLGEAVHRKIAAVVSSRGLQLQRIPFGLYEASDLEGELSHTAVLNFIRKCSAAAWSNHPDYNLLRLNKLYRGLCYAVGVPHAEMLSKDALRVWQQALEKLRS